MFRPTQAALPFLALSMLCPDPGERGSCASPGLSGELEPMVQDGGQRKRGSSSGYILGPRACPMT